MSCFLGSVRRSQKFGKLYQVLSLVSCITSHGSGTWFSSYKRKVRIWSCWQWCFGQYGTEGINLELVQRIFPSPKRSLKPRKLSQISSNLMFLSHLDRTALATLGLGLNGFLLQGTASRSISMGLHFQNWAGQGRVGSSHSRLARKCCGITLGTRSSPFLTRYC